MVRHGAWFDRDQIAHILRRDRDLRLFLLARMAMLVTTAAMPFYTVHARDVLGAPANAIGTYLALLTGAMLSTSLVWGRLADRRGTRLVTLLVAILAVPQPFVPLLFGARMSYTVFGLVYLLQGAVQAGTGVIASSYLLDLAPPEQRGVYISFANTALGLVSLALILAGWVAQAFGLTALFAVCVVAAVAAPVLAYSMREPREQAG